uniref:Thyroid hormone receptor interactor 10 n=1 Tax=Nothobranchius korthausae TaxID=1143690 RepID=A0A1A8FPA1_9TELE
MKRIVGVIGGKWVVFEFGSQNILPIRRLQTSNGVELVPNHRLGVFFSHAHFFGLSDGVLMKVENVNQSSTPTHPSCDPLQPTVTEDFAHLPPEQRRKRLQQKLEEISKDLQKEVDQSEALEKMKDVYEKNPQMGDPASLASQISQTSQKMERLKVELNKYETWLAEAGARGDTLRYKPNMFNNNGAHDALSPDGAHSDGSTPDPSQAIYAEFDDDFEDEELVAPIGECTAMYNFPGASEGTISMQEGEMLAVVEEDKGDGWTRVRRNNGDEGYIPTSYVTIRLNK